MACLYNAQTQKQQFEMLATDRGFFKTLFKTYNPELVVVEACGVSDLCADLNLEVIVCRTHEDAWMFKIVKRKTDKDAVIKLVCLASVDQLVKTHVPSKAVREHCRLIKYRKKVVEPINKSKCSPG